MNEPTESELRAAAAALRAKAAAAPTLAEKLALRAEIRELDAAADAAWKNSTR